MLFSIMFTHIDSIKCRKLMPVLQLIYFFYLGEFGVVYKANFIGYNDGLGSMSVAVKTIMQGILAIDPNWCEDTVSQFRPRPQPDRPHCRHFIRQKQCIGGHCVAPNLGGHCVVPNLGDT